MLTIAGTAWSRTPESATVVAGCLRLRSWRSAPRLLVWTHRIQRVLADAPGLVGYRFGYDPRDLAMWTVSAWSTRTALIHFERGEVHRTAIAQLRPLVHPSTFVVWTTDTAGHPPDWPAIQQRIRAVQQS